MTLAWDPSPEPIVAGYTLFYGTQSGTYTGQIAVGNRTDYTITLPDGTYYFAVQAYTVDGLTSALSNEVVATYSAAATTTLITFSPASTCQTSDPFAAMGGGTCYNGGWLPPGMAPPGSTTSATSSSTPPTTSKNTSTTSPPSGSAGSCTTADPFAAMGGGTCYNGGWLPPGMAPPSGSTSTPKTTTPSTPTQPSSTPSQTAPPASGPCTTPDPFAAMGGGTCHNGGWLPPGMTPPSGSPTTTSTSTNTTPQPSSSTQTGSSTSPSGGCITPDPFASMGGGICHNGGWLPPGMTPEISATGTMRLVSLTTPVWFIEGDDGQIYKSSSVIPSELLIDGAPVSFAGVKLSTSLVDGSILVEILAIEIQP